jgi:hypothetical protein
MVLPPQMRVSGTGSEPPHAGRSPTNLLKLTASRRNERFFATQPDQLTVIRASIHPELSFVSLDVTTFSVRKETKARNNGTTDNSPHEKYD